MKKILSIFVVFASVLAFAGCVNPLQKATNNTNNTNNTVVNPVEEKTETKSNDTINATTKKKVDVNLNEDYFFMIKNNKFKAGDKISNIASVGLKQDSRVVDQKIGKKTYLIGGGTIYNSNDKSVLNITPFNASDEEITAKDAVIGGFEIGSYDYDSIENEVLDLDISIVGGIKLGSTYEEVTSVFGTTDNTYYAESLGYTVYTFKSDKVYRSFEITVDKNNKVSRIKWQNLEFAR